MTSGLTRTDVERMRQMQPDDDVLALVEEEMRQVRVDGQHYRFRPETRCKVCRNGELREQVETLLSVGTTYREILAIIRPVNEKRKRVDRITTNSIHTHLDHYPIGKAAQRVYRSVLERRATEYDKNFVMGVGHAVTLHAILETVMVKGYAAITDERVPISPELAISAAVKLHELEAADSGAMVAAEQIAKVHRIMEAMREVCDDSQIRDILAIVEPQQFARDDVLDVEVVEDDEDEDDEFDPTADLDERFDDDDFTDTH